MSSWIAALLGAVVGAALGSSAVRWRNRDQQLPAVARQLAYDEGVAVGRELQRAITEGEAPFPPKDAGLVRYGVEVPTRPDWSPVRPSPYRRPRPGES